MFVAFPVHGTLWSQSMDTVVSLIVRFPGQYARVNGSAWIDMARAELVGQFLESAEQEMLFVDADSWFDVSIVDVMRAAKADVITATCRQKNPPHQFVARAVGGHPKKSPTRFVDGARVIEIDGDGLGCCLIRRHVIEKLCELHPELAYVTYQNRQRCNLFEYGIYTDDLGVRRAGQEDRAFFDRVRAAGFRAECLMDATVVHGGVPGRFADVLTE
jgi:hypothetical protein